MEGSKGIVINLLVNCPRTLQNQQIAYLQSGFDPNSSLIYQGRSTNKLCRCILLSDPGEPAFKIKVPNSVSIHREQKTANRKSWRLRHQWWVYTRLF